MSKRNASNDSSGSGSSESRNEFESLGLSDESNNGSFGNMYQDNDIRNAELVFDHHHNDPFEVMRIQTYDDVPMPNGPVCVF